MRGGGFFGGAEACGGLRGGDGGLTMGGTGRWSDTPDAVVTDLRGLGVDLDEDMAKKYPYQRAYLPVNRKIDGTLTDW